MRQFYIIKHNPNYVDEAIGDIKDGANAIEPDITWDDDRKDFFVYDSDVPFSSAKGKFTLANYCKGIASSLLANRDLNLALILWDLKNVQNSNFNFERIRDILMSNFVAPLNEAGYGEIPMLFTHSNNLNYFTQWASPYVRFNWGFGTDDIRSATEVDDFFKGHNFKYTYAKGGVFTFGYDKLMQTAINMRNTGHSFCFVYAWVINWQNHWKRLLAMGIDGILTDYPGKLNRLLRENYIGSFVLATKENNPFENSGTPLYV